MGRGWLKETVNELNSALVFAEPATVHDSDKQSQGEIVKSTTYNIEYPTSGSGTPETC